MPTLNLQTLKLEKQFKFFRHNLRLFSFVFFIFAASFAALFVFRPTSAQNADGIESHSMPFFRVGERLTYNVSFRNISNAAYAEIYVVSRGKLGEKDAVEVQSKIKTIDLVSSAFYSLDEKRTTYASAENNLPLYIRKTSNAGVLPKETIYNYLVNQTANNDLLTFIYQARNAGGVGTFTFEEDGKIYSVNLQSAASERVRTDAGEFETNVSTVESPFFVEKGITNLRINFSVDEARIPVLIRFKTAKGDFRAALASVQMIEPETVAEPTPVAIQTPQAQKTPRPKATATPYVENQPLSPDLPFELGETLEYQVSMLGKYFGNVTLQAKERKQFLRQDSLLLTATATETQAGNPLFNLNDGIRAQVNPDTLEPQQIELKSTGFFSQFNQTAQFDQKNGFAVFGGANRAEIPVGTHSLLSLAYAVRSFNLKPSKDRKNPVNDTRVSVFVGSKSYVFTLQPSDGEIINLKGEKIPAQLIVIITGNPSFDQLGLKLWLSNDQKRLPLRLVVGNYQADLVSETKISPK
ncbi:MAG: DUF3108 domain-containing protein [Acidobacteriota bacterium]|nr:DUF3108 domain-containing protein [Acidobacteriota bacterium]